MPKISRWHLEDFQDKNCFQLDGQFFCPCNFCGKIIKAGNPRRGWVTCDTCRNVPVLVWALSTVCKHRILAKHQGLLHTLSPRQWFRCISFFEFKCAYCGSGNCYLMPDHVIPKVERGGLVVNNILVCCKSCNSQKSKKPGIPDKISLICRASIDDYFGLSDLEKPPYLGDEDIDALLPFVPKSWVWDHRYKDM